MKLYIIQIFNFYIVFIAIAIPSPVIIGSLVEFLNNPPIPPVASIVTFEYMFICLLSFKHIPPKQVLLFCIKSTRLQFSITVIFFLLSVFLVKISSNFYQYNP